MSSPYFPAPIISTLPWAMRQMESAGVPWATMISPGAYSRCTKRPARAASTSSSSKPRNPDSSRSSWGTTVTSAPVEMKVTRPSPTE